MTVYDPCAECGAAQEVECGDCDGTGKVYDDWGPREMLVYCETCDGHGVVFKECSCCDS